MTCENAELEENFDGVWKMLPNFLLQNPQNSEIMSYVDTSAEPQNWPALGPKSLLN